MSTNKLEVRLLGIDDISPYEANAKIHDAEQVAKIAKSIKEFGWDTPIVVDENFVIIKGHGRRLAAISLGYKEVPVIVRNDLTEDQVKAARLADNRVAMGDYDTKLLQQEIENLQFDMSGLFDDKELEFMTQDIGLMNDEAFIDDVDNEVAEQQKEVEVQIKETAQRQVSVVKALGFNTVSASDELYVNRFIAKISAEFGETPEKAFGMFVKSILENDSD